MSRFVIIAGGPSLDLKQCRTIAIAKHRDPSLTVIAINDAVYPCFWADFVYACDAQWWDYHGPLHGFRGGKISLIVPDQEGKDRNKSRVEGLELFTASGTDGLDERPGFIRTGKNSGFQATHIAYHMGAKKIVWVGFDFKNFNNHWFGQHPSPVRRSTLGINWVTWITDLGMKLRDRGVEIVNATPGSAITAFPFVDLRTELGVTDV